MQTITINSDNNSHYTAFKDGEALGTLSYPKWYSQNAEITIGTSAYHLEAKGFWKPVIEVYREDKPILLLKTKWRGTEISPPKEPHRFFMLGPKGWFKSGYTLKNYKGETVMEIEQEWVWKKFRTNFKISSLINIESEEDILLALVVAHCYRAALNAAAAGAAAAS